MGGKKIKREKIVTFRLPENVFDEWNKTAQKANITFSDFIRASIDEKQKSGITPARKKPRREAFSKVDHELLREIARIGNNLNQLARWVNIYKAGIEAVLLTAHLSAIQCELQKLLPPLPAGDIDAD